MYRLLLAFGLLFVSLNALAERNTPDLAVMEDLGEKIYFIDKLAWIATDFLMEKNILQTDPNSKGWIVDVSKKPYAVHFMGPALSGPKIFHSVYFGDDLKPSYQKDAATENYHQQMFSARSLALQNIPMRCTERYNTVILPSPNGWVIYLLASTSKAGILVIGGHGRITTNLEGSSIIKAEKLYSSCMEINPNEGVPVGAKAVGVTVTDMQNLYPTEVMVFLSKEHETSLYVSTTSNKKIWEVKEGKIKQIKK